MGCGYVDEVRRLRERLEPFIPKWKLPYPRWIVTPDGDLGSEWCRNCGYYKVRNLRRRDRRRAEDYILDGGWRTEEDGHRFCAGCGVRLDVGLTKHGVYEEVDHFEELGFSTDPEADAYELGELLDAVDYRSDGEDSEEERVRTSVMAIVERFLAEREKGAS